MNARASAPGSGQALGSSPNHLVPDAGSPVAAQPSQAGQVSSSPKGVAQPLAGGSPGPAIWIQRYPSASRGAPTTSDRDPNGSVPSRSESTPASARSETSATSVRTIELAL